MSLTREGRRKERAELVLEILRTHIKQLAENEFTIGKCFREIKRDRLFLVFGHTSFSSWFSEQNFPFKLCKAHYLITIAALIDRLGLTPLQAKAFGVSRLRHLAAAQRTLPDAAFQELVARVKDKPYDEVLAELRAVVPVENGHNYKRKDKFIFSYNYGDVRSNVIRQALQHAGKGLTPELAMVNICQSYLDAQTPKPQPTAKAKRFWL